MTDRFLKNS